MNTMLNILDIFNLIDSGEFLLSALRYGDLGRTIKVQIVERGVTGEQCETMLRTYRIPVYGRRVRGGCYVFRVKSKQHAWAVDLLHLYGARLVGVKARPWVWGKPAGYMPPAWEARDVQ